MQRKMAFLLLLISFYIIRPISPPHKPFLLQKGKQEKKQDAGIIVVHSSTCTQDRGCKRLFHSIGVDTRRSKSEKEAKDNLEKERNKAGWTSWEVAKAMARECWECWSESLTALCAY